MLATKKENRQGGDGGIKMSKPNSTNVEEYIKSFPISTQKKLNQLRSLILKVSPSIQESIAYGMPGYKIDSKPYVYFGAFSKHIGLYALPQGTEEFKKLSSKYKTSKGTIQFPLEEDLPLDLIKALLIKKLS